MKFKNWIFGINIKFYKEYTLSNFMLTPKAREYLKLKREQYQERKDLQEPKNQPKNFMAYVEKSIERIIMPW